MALSVCYTSLRIVFQQNLKPESKIEQNRPFEVSKEQPKDSAKAFAKYAKQGECTGKDMPR